MKILKVCLLATLVAIGANAAPKTQAQINRERAAQRQAAKKTDDAKAAQRTRDHQRDMKATAERHRGDNSTGEDIVRNAEEAGDNIVDTGKDIRDWFGF